MSEVIEKYLLCEEHIDKCKKPLGLFNSKHIEDEPCLMCEAEKLQLEKDALVARVARLEEIAENYIYELDDALYFLGIAEHGDIQMQVRIDGLKVKRDFSRSVLNETPQQSLAEIEAAAVLAYGQELYANGEDAMTPEEYAETLRQKGDQ